MGFTNDLEDADELNATWGPENQRKADYGPDRWLPPNSAFRCAYVAAYARIKARWELTVSPAQRAAVERVWSGCEASRRTASATVDATCAGADAGATRSRRQPVAIGAGADVVVMGIGTVEVEAAGAEALQYAVEGIAAARALLAHDGREIAVAPSRVDHGVDGAQEPVLRLRVLRATLSAGQLHELLRAGLQDLVGGVDDACLDAVADRFDCGCARRESSVSYPQRA